MIEERTLDTQSQTLNFSSAKLITSTLQEISTHVDLSEAHDLSKEILTLKVFVMNFEYLLEAVAPYVDILSKNLLGGLLISKGSYDRLKILKRFNIGPRERTVIVLVLLQLSITVDWHCLQRLMKILNRFPPLMHITDTLKNSSYSMSEQTLIHVVLQC